MRLAIERWGIAVPLLLAAAAYARVLGAEFQFDDFTSIVENPLIKDLPRFMRERFWPGWASGQRPLTDLTFALQYRLSGLEPFAYHLVNVGLHLGATLLAWAVGRSALRLSGHANLLLALAVAALFAVHPLHSQAVSYVVQRAEVLSSALYLGALLLLLHSGEHAATPRGRAAFVLAIPVFVLAMGAKTIAITMPAAYLLLANALPPRRAGEALPRLRRTVVRAAPFVVIALVFAALTLKGLRGEASVGFDMSPEQRRGSYLLAQLPAVLLYLRLLVWPSGQNVDHDFAPAYHLHEPRVLASAVAIAVFFALAAWLVVHVGRRDDARGARARLSGVGIGWFFLVISPTSSFVPVADLVMEHRAYLASWGALLAIVAGADQILARRSARQRLAVGAGATAAAMLALYAALFARNAVWETPLALWSDAAAKSPRRARPISNVGYALAREGRREEALSAYRSAMALPDPTADTLANVVAASVLLFELGRVQEAAETLEGAVTRSPSDARLRNDLANVRLSQGRIDDAEVHARRAVALAPDSDVGHGTLGLVLSARGDHGAALAAMQSALRLNPDDPKHAFNAAVELASLGRGADACAAFRRAAALTRDPGLHERVRAWTARIPCS